MKYYLKEELFGIDNKLKFSFYFNGEEERTATCSISSAMKKYFDTSNSDLFSAVSSNGDKIFIDGTPGVWVAAYLKLPCTDCEVIIAMLGEPPFEYTPLQNIHGEGKISPEYTF